MKCPSCGENTPDDWLPFVPAYRRETVDKPVVVKSGDPELSGPNLTSYVIQYMRCANKKCEQPVIALIEAKLHPETLNPSMTNGSIGRSSQSWVVVPRHANRPIDPLVREKEPALAEDFGEAANILNSSPRMSAVLARRIADDLLVKYAKRTEYFLGEKLRVFAEDTNYNSTLRRGLQALNQLGIFGAHTKVDQTDPISDQPAILNVTLEQAEWTLGLVERLFDVFIVSQAQDEAMIEAVEEMQRRSKSPPREGPAPE